MAYLASIGIANDGSVVARGYHVYRRGPIVYMYWGGIELGPDALFYWRRSTQHKIEDVGSPKWAKKFVESVIDRRFERGYAQLPPGVRIHRNGGSRKSFSYRR